jgi:hypothetical protein
MLLEIFLGMSMVGQKAAQDAEYISNKSKSRNGGSKSFSSYNCGAAILCAIREACK